MEGGDKLDLLIFLQIKQFKKFQYPELLDMFAKLMSQPLATMIETTAPALSILTAFRLLIELRQ
jgi:hypothetical protein